MTEKPVKWRVSAIPDAISVETQRASQPYECEFDTEEEANEYKKQVKREGWIACVTPVYVTRATVIRRNKKAEINPFPHFNKEWRLHHGDES